MSIETEIAEKLGQLSIKTAEESRGDIKVLMSLIQVLGYHINLATLQAIIDKMKSGATREEAVLASADYIIGDFRKMTEHQVQVLRMFDQMTGD